MQGAGERKKKFKQTSKFLIEVRGSAMGWSFQNAEQLGGKKGCVGIQVEKTILKTEGAKSKAGNTRVRIFILWMLVEALSVDKLAWKRVESKKIKVTRTIPG